LTAGGKVERRTVDRHEEHHVVVGQVISGRVVVVRVRVRGHARTIADRLRDANGAAGERSWHRG
jgi:hypothetical protein